MEFATGPLPSRAPDAMSTEDRGDPWNNFLRRVLVSVGLGDENESARDPGEQLRLSVPPTGDGEDLLAG